jgi:hypothetical protein
MRTLSLAIPLLACALACSSSSNRAPGCNNRASNANGPGDPNAYFPMTTGSVWNYEVSSPIAFPAFGRLEVAGARPGTGAQIFRATLLGDAASAPADTYYSKDASGITEESGSATDGFSTLVLPFQRLAFPLEAGRSFTLVDCVSLDLGQDVDFDSRHDSFDYRVDLSASAAVSVAVPWGSLSSLPVTTNTNIVLHPTRSLPGSAQIQRSEWYAAGIGLVQSSILQTIAGVPSQGQTLKLLGYSVNGREKGMVRYGQLATSVAPADSNLLVPGKPALSFDGSSHLVVSAQASGNAAPTPSKAYLVAGDGAVSPAFQLADSGFGGTAAFDGANHLVVLHGCTGACGFIGQRVTPTGQLLDGSGGFAVSDMGEDAQFPALAFGASRYLFVYTRSAGGNVDLRGVRIDPAGSALDNFSIRGPLAAPSLGSNAPSVAFDGENYLVAWADIQGTDTSTNEILAARVSPAGVVLDSPPLAISTSPGTKSLGGIACDGTRCLVAWSNTPAGGVANVYAARIDQGGALLDGLPATGGIVVNTLAGQSKQAASVAFDGSEFVLTWWIDGDVSPAGVYAARVSSEGVLLDQAASGIQVSRVSRFGSRAVYPSVAAAGSGRTLIAWAYNSQTVGLDKSIEGVWYRW